MLSAFLFIFSTYFASVFSHIPLIFLRPYIGLYRIDVHTSGHVHPLLSCAVSSHHNIQPLRIQHSL